MPSLSYFYTKSVKSLYTNHHSKKTFESSIKHLNQEFLFHVTKLALISIIGLAYISLYPSTLVTLSFSLIMLSMAIWTLKREQVLREQSNEIYLGLAHDGVSEDLSYYRKSHDQRVYYTPNEYLYRSLTQIISSMMLISSVVLITQALYDASWTDHLFDLNGQASTLSLWYTWVLTLTIEALDIFDVMSSFDISLQNISYTGAAVSSLVIFYKLTIDALVIIKVTSYFRDRRESQELINQLIEEPSENLRASLVYQLAQRGRIGEQLLLKRLPDLQSHQLTHALDYFTSYATLSALPLLIDRIDREADNHPTSTLNVQRSLSINSAWPMLAHLFREKRLISEQKDFEECIRSGPLVWRLRKMNTQDKRQIFIGETPVTQDLWHCVMGYDPSDFVGSQRPVETINLIEALLFCNELSRRCELDPVYHIKHLYKDTPLQNSPDDISFVRTLTEYDLFNSQNSQDIETSERFLFQITMNQEATGYRLPTPEERQHLTAIEPLSHAWTQENSHSQSHFVFSLPPSKGGFYDVKGNISEWCWAPQDQEKNSIKGSSHYLSGSWRDPHEQGDRGNVWSFKSNTVGLRIVRGELS